MMQLEMLGRLVTAKAPCIIHMRSCPESVIEGTIENYDVQCDPSMLVVTNIKGRKIVNMQDISLIAEKPRE